MLDLWLIFGTFSNFLAKPLSWFIFRNADMIVAIQDGVVCEKGTHDELMSLNGLYFSLVTRYTGRGSKHQTSIDGLLVTNNLVANILVTNNLVT